MLVVLVRFLVHRGVLFLALSRSVSLSLSLGDGLWEVMARTVFFFVTKLRTDDTGDCTEQVGVEGLG